MVGNSSIRHATRKNWDLRGLTQTHDNEKQKAWTKPDLLGNQGM